MNTVLTRRFNEYRLQKDISFSQLPDLILIDGGIIQLTFAMTAMKECGLNIDMVSLAKREEEIYKPDGTKVILSKDNFALKLLQNVRDESHRFAITFQKSLRQKTALKSQLENIELIGKSKVNILFDKFKTIENIKSATIEDLQSVNGIGKKLAENIYKFFHSE
jgi:excinuclease ABC subunit C